MRAPSPPSALMIYIEPTTYIVDLVSAVRKTWPHRLDVKYLGANLSQRWDTELGASNGQVLEGGALAMLREVARLIRSENYDVVHLAGWARLSFLGALVLGRLCGVAVIVESDSFGTPGQSALKRAAKAVLMPLLFRMPSFFLPGGQNQKKYLQSFGVSEDRIKIAQMTVDVTRIARSVDRKDSARRRAARERFGLAADAAVFLYVGRLEPHKGLSDLIAAFRDLSGSGAQLVIAGSGSLHADLAQAGREIPNLHVLGRLADEALLDAYRAADALILPSLFEPWGLVVNEAMAAGLPVIVSDRVGCAPDLVIDGETGLIFPAGDAQALRAAMLRLMSESALREGMSLKASQLISGWTVENEARIITSTWESLVRP